MRIAFIIFFCAWSVGAVSAQTRDIAGGHAPDITNLSTAAARELARLQDSAAPRVERRSDSLLNGALIGAAAGIAAGLSLCTLTEPWRNCRDDVGPMLRIGALGAAIGIGIDALIREKETFGAVGTAQVHVAPTVGRRGGGLRLAVRF